MKIKAALAAGALVVAAGAVGVVASSTAQAEMAGWERIETTTTIGSGSGVGSAESYCTSGKKATGGGFDTDQSAFNSSGAKIVTNKPTGSGSGWTMTFQKGSNSFDVTVVVVCATP